MNQDSIAIKNLTKYEQTKQTGLWEFRHNSVVWDIYFIEGKIHHAQHNLQSLDTLKSLLFSLNLTKIDFNSIPRLPAGEKFPLLWIINQLVTYKSLSRIQSIILLRQLTQDALESYLCCVNGEGRFISNFDLPERMPIIMETRWNTSTLVKFSVDKLKQWQKLQPFIKSPHQRPSCKDLSLLEKPISGGNLSPQMLEKLAGMMKGLSLRSISVMLKQDETKLAQLLLPYIKHQVITIYPPKSPLDKLPIILRANDFIPSTQILKAQIDSISVVNREDINRYNPVLNTVNNEKKSNVFSNISTNKSNYKIVCIDDSEVMLNTIKEYLASEQYEISTVPNPMQSLPTLFASKPNLILLDLSMPNINGNRLCKILRGSPTFKNVPIVIVSGNTNLLSMEKIKEFGANNYLAKPFTKEQLLEMVTQYLTVAQKVS
ncbi:MAG: response regulator [Cyanobacterium sp. T60_A2020_053]|nr:response regulator [Cyanobacterium sp. T60_A2020_053]